MENRWFHENIIYFLASMREPLASISFRSPKKSQHFLDFLNFGKHMGNPSFGKSQFYNLATSHDIPIKRLV